MFGHETWNVAKVPKLHIYSLSTQEVEIELSFALRAGVSEIWANFQNCHIWARNLASGQSSRSCTYTSTLFLPQGGEIKLNFALQAAVSKIRANFQNCHIFGHETWQLAKVPEDAHILSFYPRESKLSLFLLYGQRFSRYGPIFRMAIFGHETWQVAKLPEVCTYALFLPQEVEIDPMFALRAAVSEIIGDNFQNCHIWAWNLAIGQSTRTCTRII